MSDIQSPDALPQAFPPAPPAAAAPLVLAHTPDALSNTARERRFTVRVWCTFVFAMCIGMLGLGAWLKPDARGVETHTQLGLPPCGFFMATGLPCPTCGCTTAVSNFAHGRLLSSFATQPFGFLVGLVALLVIPFSAIGMISGKWLGPSTFMLGWYWPVWLYGGLGWLLVSWIYKIYMVKTFHISP